MEIVHILIFFVVLSTMTGMIVISTVSSVPANALPHNTPDLPGTTVNESSEGNNFTNTTQAIQNENVNTNPT
jgi:hypothetical protein